MSNPWLKKNPFMRLWLSAADRVEGTLRDHARTQAKRQVNAAMTEATREKRRLVSDEVKPTAARTKGR